MVALRLCAAAVVAIYAAGCSTLAPNVNDALTPSLKTLDGETLPFDRLVPTDGGRLLLVYSTIWCRRCRKERPDVERWAARHEGTVAVRSINSGSSADRVRANIRRLSLLVKHAPMFVDPSGELAEFHRVHATPTLILFGSDGREIGRYGSILQVPTVPLEDSKPSRLEVSDRGTILGTSFHVVVLAGRTQVKAARAAIAAGKAKAAALDRVLSEWRHDSEISRVNRHASQQIVPIGQDLRTILTGASAVSKLTSGAFDVTWRPLGELWDDAARRGVWPTDEALALSRSAVGHHRVTLHTDGVRLSGPSVKLGIAGVAKGYIIDAWFLHLVRAGYDSVIVNIGGDLRAVGKTATGDRRSYLIADPYAPGKKFIGRLEVDAAAIATSGNYWRQRMFTLPDGTQRQVGHIVDPRTGRPPTFDGSVTVLTRDTAMADALATGLYVLGPERGLALARRMAGVDAIYASRDGLRATVQVQSP